MIRIISLAGIAALPSIPTDPPLPPLTVYAAGSATGVLGELLKRYRAATGEVVELRTGPAGLMREKIEAGDKVDLFISADMDHPRKLHASGKARATVVFARNRLCVSALRSVGLTRTNMLSRLLDPQVRIGTSTPKADPGGDYALAFFKRAESVRSGAAATLAAKAKQTVGGKIETVPAKPMDAAEALEAQGVDVSIGYCSARKTTPDGSVDKVQVPDRLAVRIEYGMAVVTTSADAKREAAAGRLARYLLSPAAQSVLASYGFVKASQQRSGGIRKRVRVSVAIRGRRLSKGLMLW